MHGSCSDVITLKGGYGGKLLNPLSSSPVHFHTSSAFIDLVLENAMAAQNFECIMSNIFDKPLYILFHICLSVSHMQCGESVFSCITTVLPGAFIACTCILCSMTALVVRAYCNSTFSMKRWYTSPFCGSLSKKARYGAGLDIFATHSDPQTNADPALGVCHTAELPYLFGSPSTSGPPKLVNFTQAMMDNLFHRHAESERWQWNE